MRTLELIESTVMPTSIGTFLKIEKTYTFVPLGCL